jgi:hypothetical protein
MRGIQPPGQRHIGRKFEDAVVIQIVQIDHSASLSRRCLLEGDPAPFYITAITPERSMVAFLVHRSKRRLQPEFGKIDARQKDWCADA